MTIIKKLFSFFCIIFITQPVWAESHLISAQVVGNNQLLFRFTESTSYRTFALNHPERFVMDFSQTKLNQPLSHFPLNDLPIRSIRTSVNAKQTLRIVLDLSKKQSVHTKFLSTAPGKPKLFSITFNANPKPAETGLVSARQQAKKQTTKQTPTKAVPTAKATYQKKLVIIVIDPGHGGKDPGAHGPDGTREKDVVLGISRQLYTLINREPGMRAVLTRKGDYFINLRQRLTIARQNSGDLFISIHADAFQNPYSHGASVYALSEKGGTSEAARWLAAKENYSELGGVNLDGLDDKNGMVRSVLIDLSETATIGASLDLGGDVLDSIGDVTHLHHHHVEQAQFVVLKSLDIPSILVETGFISNHQEEKNLSNPAYQAKIAQSILHGIQYYLRQHPPVGSYWVKNG